MRLNNDLIDLVKYPIDRPDSKAYQAIVAESRLALSNNDYLNLERFLSESGTELIEKEIDALSPTAVHIVNESTAYGNSETKDLPANHPYNIKHQSDRYSLARHQLRNTQLDSIYSWEPVRNFVRDVLELPEIYLHEDPSNALVVQIYKRSGGIAWHFDRALFSTILNIRESGKGGTFECAPNIRTDIDPCHGEVQAVLLQQSNRVQQHNVKAGSFTIMRGRYTLHRVTENLSQTPRYSVVLSYEDKPGVKLDEATRKRLFGETAPGD